MAPWSHRPVAYCQGELGQMRAPRQALKAMWNRHHSSANASCIRIIYARIHTYDAYVLVFIHTAYVLIK